MLQSKVMAVCSSVNAKHTHTRAKKEAKLSHEANFHSHTPPLLSLLFGNSEDKAYETCVRAKTVNQNSEVFKLSPPVTCCLLEGECSYLSVAYVITALGEIPLNIWAIINTTTLHRWAIMSWGQRQPAGESRKIIKPGHCVDMWFSYQTSEDSISPTTAFSHPKTRDSIIAQMLTSLYFWPGLVGDMRY